MAIDWPTVRLGELFEIKHGFAFKGEHFTDAGNFVLLTPGNFIEEGGLKLKGDKEKFYSGQFPNEYLLHKGDIVLAMTDLTQNAPILGSAAVIPQSGRYLHNQRLGKIINLKVDRVLPKFVYHLFNTPLVREKIKGSATGATVKHTAPSRIYSISVQIPPLLIQQRITNILSAYDELIENSHQRMKILEAMVRSLYHEWFANFRFPDHERHRKTPSLLGDIPQGWEVVSIDDVCNRVTDGSHSSPKSVSEGLPMASSKDMHDWGLTIETCRFISREDFDSLARNDCRPKKNDILITKDGANYLKYIFVNRSERDVVLLSSIAILRPNARINPHLLAATLGYPQNKNRLKNYVTGAAIPRIILKDFKRFQFVLPSTQVQGEWAKRVEPMIELCWRLMDQIQNLRRTRDLLLPRLLSGQIDLGAV